MRIRRSLAVLTAVATGLASAAVVLVAAEPAAAASPTRILNTSSGGGLPSWAETQSTADDADQNGRNMTVTFLAEHVVGRRITQVFIDNGISGTDSTVGVTSQAYPTPTTNGMETSRVTLTFDPGRAGGYTCPFAGGATRRRTGMNMGFRVIDNTGEQSALVSASVFAQVEKDDCFGRTDFIDIHDQFQSTTTAVPGQDVTFSFQGDDDDSTGNNDHFDKYRPRLRRLNDGLIVSLAEVNPSGDNDNDELTFTTDFPSRGRWVVEIEPGGEDGYGESGTYFRLGAVDVNHAAAPTASIGFTATPTSALFASTPPSVNANIPVNAVLTASDTGGAAQIAEWDATNDGTFERFEYTVPALGGTAHPALTTTELTQSVSTATFGNRSVRARVTDNGAIDGSDTIRRQTTVSGDLHVNAIPTANNQTVTTSEDTGTSFTLGGNDADNQPGLLAYTVLTTPPAAAGVLTCSSLPACSFAPAGNFSGSTSFTFRTADGPVASGSNAGQAWSISNTATVTINVTAVNDAPTANAQSVSTAEDTAKIITLTGSDIEPGTLTFGIVSGPMHGMLTGTGASRTYTPAGNFHGSDSFVFSVTDAGGLVGTATVSITVTPVNDAPVPVNQTLNTDEDDDINFSLAASDVDGDIVSFSAPTSGPGDGGVSCVGAACTYTPDDDFNGTDSFTFTANDGTGNPNSTATGTITINVAPVNDAPEAEAQSVTLDEDTPTDITLGATDVDLDPLTFTVVDGPTNGTTTPLGGAVVTYEPDDNYFGGDQFEFEASDGDLSDTAIVVLTINPVNDAPTLDPQSFATDEDTAQILSVTASDIDGDELSYSVVGGPANGILVGSLPDVGYLPNDDFFGTDTFEVAVFDGAATVTATMTIEVAPINDAPVATPVSVTVDEDTDASFSLAASDIDSSSLTVTVPTSTTNGTLDCTGTSCTYSPNENFHGSDLAIFEVSDGTLTDSASVSITVSPVNDPPVPAPVTVATDEDTPAAVTLSATDVDGDALTFSVVSPPLNGSLEGDAPTLVYEPSPNFFGTDTIDYAVSDGSATVAGLVLIWVAPVNDAPDAIDVSASTGEDDAVSFTLSATDVDSTGLTFTVDTPSSGIVSCDGTDCLYTPADDFAGVVTFGFEASDGALSDRGLVTIAVAQENDPPEASDTEVTTDEDTPVGIALEATDVDGDALTYQVVSGPSEGTLAGVAPDLVYTPGTNFNGDDSFVWAASDGNGGSVSATVSITVSPVNDAPVALPRVVAANEDTTVTFSLLAEDAEGDALTFVAGAAGNGTVACTAAGACSYTPATNYTGVDSFGFTVSDPSGASSSATVTITIAAAPLILTQIVAEPLLLTLGPVFRARLSQVGTNAPVPGRVVVFTAGGQVRCQAVTDANGNAICGAPLLDLPALLNLGYDATFAGDFDYAPSTGRGILLRLTIRLF